MDTALSSLYYDPSLGLGGANALYQRAKEAKLKVTKAQVTSYLQAQETAQVFKQRTVKHFFPLVAHYPFSRVQLDLADVSNWSHWNSGIHFLMVCIDLNTRYVFVVPLRSKGLNECLGGWKKIVASIVSLRGYPPRQVDSDQEPSFASGEFRAFCEENSIHQNFAALQDYRGTGTVEAFIRTLRLLLQHLFTAFHTRSYVSALPALVENYNTRQHSFTKLTPAEAVRRGLAGEATPYEGTVSKQRQQATGEAERKDYPSYAVGERVRVLLRRRTFSKGTEPKWSSDLHTIERYEQGLLYVSGRVSGYQPYELLRVSGEVGQAPGDLPERQEVEAEVVAQQSERRLTRGLAKEGVARSDLRDKTDEEKSERAVRGRKPRDLGPYISRQ